MKKTILKITALGLFAAAMFVAPVPVRAADTNAAPAEAATHHKRSDHATLPFNGKLTAVDTNAMTLTVGERTFEITSETKITKDGFPATLSDGVVGEMAGGSFRKGDDGKLTAMNIHFGTKAAGSAARKKKTVGENVAPSAATNSVAK
jgi:hypothetical protein